MRASNHEKGEKGAVVLDKCWAAIRDDAVVGIVYGRLPDDADYETYKRLAREFLETLSPKVRRGEIVQTANGDRLFVQRQNHPGRKARAQERYGTVHPRKVIQPAFAPKLTGRVWAVLRGNLVVAAVAKRVPDDVNIEKHASLAKQLLNAVGGRIEQGTIVERANGVRYFIHQGSVLQGDILEGKEEERTYELAYHL